MEAGFSPRSHADSIEGRPYRSHLHPACFSCRKRKSRCKTREKSDNCVMCQVHGTGCVFPQIDEKSQRRSTNSSRRLSSAKAMKTRFAQRKQMPLNLTFPSSCSSSPQAISRQLLDSGSPQIELPSQVTTRPLMEYPEPSSFHNNNNENRQEPFSDLMGISAEIKDDNCHVVSPAIAGDNDVLENYLSTIPNARGRRMIRKISSSNSDPENRPVRPVLFNTVQRQPLGVTTNQSLASMKCEIIEKLIEPHVNDLLDLFFLKANICFPIFDEASFRNIYNNNKQKISPALLSNLYANALIYWESSPKLRTSRYPDIRFIWVQASEALNSELFLSPGVSTVIAIILNVCGRPSTSIFGNGGLIGTAVALSSGLGLNRDPSNWDISPSEKRFRIRIWWLVVVHERWCSLAYGTPLQIHRAQYDVPIPTMEDLCDADATPSQVEATSVFIALVTLTELLGHYLEHVYRVPKINPPRSPEMSTMDLELLLSEWEETLSDDIRRIVTRGVNLNAPGAANFRLAYLAVKLLLRRIQLDLDQGASRTETNTASRFFTQAQRAAEDIVHLVRELDESHLYGFWIPVNAFSLTSATTFLLRSALGQKHSDRNVPLQLAKDMINTLRSHCQNFSWDLADNCLANCGDTLEKIEAGSNALTPAFPDFQEYLNIDASVLDELFPGYGQPPPFGA